MAQCILMKPYIQSDAEETLLWTNPNPKNAFARQKVSVNLNGYDYVCFEYAYDNKNTFPQNYKSYFPLNSDYLFSGDNRYAMSIIIEKLTNDSFGYQRPISFEDNKQTLDIRDCNKIKSSTLANNYCIPIKIYGVKGNVKDVPLSFLTTTISTSNNVTLPVGEYKLVIVQSSIFNDDNFKHAVEIAKGQGELIYLGKQQTTQDYAYVRLFRIDSKDCEITITTSGGSLTCETIGIK